LDALSCFHDNKMSSVLRTYITLICSFYLQLPSFTSHCIFKTLIDRIQTLDISTYLQIFNASLPVQNSKQVGVATLQQWNPCPRMVSIFFENRFWFHLKMHKTVQTKLTPVSVLLNCMRPNMVIFHSILNCVYGSISVIMC